MKNKRLLVLVLLLFAILAFSFLGWHQQGKTAAAGMAVLKVDVFSNGDEKEYSFTNLTALQLLQEENKVDLTYSQYGAFVNCINDICSSNDYYWMFYVNGNLSEKGAGSYPVQDKDIVEFRYEKLSF